MSRNLRTTMVTFYVFFVIGLATRRVEIAGITPNPNEAWMMQIGRNLTDPDDGCLSHKRFLIMDRDSKYSLAFRTLLNHSGIEIVRLPPRSPNLNAYVERFVRSIEDECLNRMIFFGDGRCEGRLVSSPLVTTGRGITSALKID